jgi:hypothetical protein
MKKLIAGLMLGFISSVAFAAGVKPPPDEIVIIDELRRDGGACGVVEAAAGCWTVTIWSTIPPTENCRCPWDLTSIPSPCAPGDEDCSE